MSSGFKYNLLQRVKPRRLKHYLRDHPDRELVKYVIDGYTQGFSLGLSRIPLLSKTCRNGRNVRRHPEIAQQLINEQIELGHILGPFDIDNPPFEDIVFNPINIVPKQQKDSWRLILDLAHPYNDQSINACIPEENSSVQYHHIDEVVKMGIALGRQMWGCRIDVQFTFMNQPLAYSQLKYCAFSLANSIYVFASLPFGAASSCTIWEKIACCLQWVVSNETGCYWISHFLDDFPLLHQTRPELIDFMNSSYRIMNDIGMPIARHKMLGPTQVLEYLGLILNFILQTIHIPEKKRLKCLELINSLSNSKGKKVTVKMIQQTAGSLNFICQAMPAGRPFLQSLYRLTRNSDGCRARGGHHRRLNAETLADLAMFREFLQENANPFCNSIPFLNKVRKNNSDIELYADAAGARDLGVRI